MRQKKFFFLSKEEDISDQIQAHQSRNESKSSEKGSSAPQIIPSLQRCPKMESFRNLTSSRRSLISSPSLSRLDRSPIDYDSADITPLSGTFLQKDRGENESAVELSVSSHPTTVTTICKQINEHIAQDYP